jgi:acyl-CoA thioesterase II
LNPLLGDLVRLMQPERIEENLFRGESRDLGSGQVFGGQVLGQALAAAGRTVDSARAAHSLHAYFLRAGDPRAPIIYDVDRARDGRSFSVRRVVAIQHGRPIFNLAASFHVQEPGFEHQAPMPDVPGPEGLTDTTDLAPSDLTDVPEKLRRMLMRQRAFQFRPVEPMKLLRLEPHEPVKHVWIKAVDPLPDDDALHRSLLAYVSDYELLGTVTLPHGIRLGQDDLKMASLDHAMWLHRPPRVDRWMLYAFDSPSAGGARGLGRGMLFAEDGTLIASTAQEGLVRVRQCAADSRSGAEHGA